MAAGVDAGPDQEKDRPQVHGRRQVEEAQPPAPRLAPELGREAQRRQHREWKGGGQEPACELETPASGPRRQAATIGGRGHLHRGPRHRVRRRAEGQLQERQRGQRRQRPAHRRAG